MANPFRARQVPSNTQDEIKARTDDKKRIEWTGVRFPWVHMLSCAGGSGRFGELSSTGNVQSVFGTNPSTAVLNNEASRYGLPLPHIDGLEVKALGSLGTTRKATVKLKCYSDEDLVELQKSFFIPGMDVRVQWGWSVACNGDSPPPLVLSKSIEQTDAICKINNLRRDNPIYDGFQGICSNFKYDLSAENVWDCEIQIISAADPFSKSKLGNDSCPKCTREIENDQGESKENFGPVYAMLSDIYNDGSGAATRLMRRLAANFGRQSYHKWASWEYEGVERTAIADAKDGSWYDGIFGGEETEEFFISFGAFIDMLNCMSIPNKGGGVFPLGKIDLSASIVPYPGFLGSADIRVCYVQGGDIDVEDIFNENEEGSSMVDAVVFDSSRGGLGVDIKNIMCNVVWLNKEYKSVYDGDQKLKTLVDNVLNGINRVCGNPWQFVTIATTEDCEIPNKNGPTVTILDERQKMKALSPYMLPTLSTNSVLKTFGLNLKMSGAMTTQALYANNGQKGGNATNQGDGNCSGVGFAAFYSGNQIKNLAKPEPGSLKQECGECEEGDKSTDPPDLEELLENQRDGEINDQTTGALLTYIREQLDEDDPDSCAGVPLPFDLNFELEGIGGFEFGQLVSSDRVPAEVRNGFRWQITKVEHSIQNNEWITKCSTVARANPFGDTQALPRASSK